MKGKFTLLIILLMVAVMSLPALTYAQTVEGAAVVAEADDPFGNDDLDDLSGN